jgi:hypothetical protein
LVFLSFSTFPIDCLCVGCQRLSPLSEGNTGLKDTNYADDLALLSHTEDHMQEKTRKLEENARMIGLMINAQVIFSATHGTVLRCFSEQICGLCNIYLF